MFVKYFFCTQVNIMVIMKDSCSFYVGSSPTLATCFIFYMNTTMKHIIKNFFILIIKISVYFLNDSIDILLFRYYLEEEYSSFFYEIHLYTKQEVFSDSYFDYFVYLKK